MIPAVQLLLDLAGAAIRQLSYHMGPGVGILSDIQIAGYLHDPQIRIGIDHRLDILLMLKLRRRRSRGLRFRDGSRHRLADRCVCFSRLLPFAALHMDRRLILPHDPAPQKDSAGRQKDHGCRSRVFLIGRTVPLSAGFI